MKDLSPLHYFLSMKVHRTSTGLHLTQTKYITDFLKHTKMFECKPISTPAINGRRLNLSDGEPLSDIIEFRSVVGALQYLLYARSDIAFVVNQVCQFMHKLIGLLLSESSTTLKLPPIMASYIAPILFISLPMPMQTMLVTLMIDVLLVAIAFS